MFVLVSVIIHYHHLFCLSIIPDLANESPFCWLLCPFEMSRSFIEHLFAFWHHMIFMNYIFKLTTFMRYLYYDTIMWWGKDGQGGRYHLEYINIIRNKMRKKLGYRFFLSFQNISKQDQGWFLWVFFYYFFNVPFTFSYPWRSKESSSNLLVDQGGWTKWSTDWC